MALRPYSCANCGHWQRWFAPPPSCPVCTDVRNGLPEDGWRFVTDVEIAAGRTARWTEVAPGVTGFWCEPQIGLGTTGWVIESDAGPVGWEAAGYYPPEGLIELRRRGGLVALGASHVHGYGALWQLQDELAPPVVAIGVGDLPWTKAFRVTWPTDDRHELAPGLVMHRSGGHFPGHTVLHDERRRILFAGDLIKVELTGTTPVGLSCHKAFPAQIPLSHAEIRHARALVEQLDFDAVATPFEYAAPVSTKQVLALFDHQLAGQPSAGPIPLDGLGGTTSSAGRRTRSAELVGAPFQVEDRLRATLPAGEYGGFDIGAVDRLGLPVFALDYVGASTPPSGGIGYGYTIEQARIGAFGELVEALLLHEHLQTLSPRRASHAELRRAVGTTGVVDPRALVLPAGTVVDDDQPRDWLPALRWRTGETVLIPAEFCGSCPAHLPQQDPGERLITMITNGDGAGDTAERAVAHGLLELLQRDGNGTTFRALDQGVVLDLDAVGDPVTRAVLDLIQAAGIELLAKLASTQFGMADVYVVGIDTDPNTEPLAVTACGEAVHPDREVALRKALLEYVSSRSRKVFMHGPLDRLRPLAPEVYWARTLALPVPPQEPRTLEAMRDWVRRTPAELLALLEPTVLARRSSVAFSSLPTVAPGSLDDPAELLTELLTRLADFDVLVVFAPGNGAVAAKVIVPGLEVETMSYGRIGARGVAKLMEHRPDLAGLGAPPHEGAAPVVLTAEGRDRLGDDAWLDLAAVARTVGPLYPLYREPDRHALARLEATS